MSGVIAPLSGEVIEVNQAVVETPEVVNDDPYGAGWLCRVRMSGEADGLLDVTGYRALLEQE